jgi:hypothetical protein
MNVSQLTARELLAAHVSIATELRERGYTRTDTSLTGELMEHVVALAYDGELARPGTKSLDVVGGRGQRIQVKTRTLLPTEWRFFQFKDSATGFDLAVVVSLDRADYTILWARELTAAEVQELAAPHTSGPRLRMRAASTAGVDVTERLRAAYDQLR